MAQRDVTQSVRLDGMKAGELKEFLQDVPSEASLSLEHVPRDRPFDSEVNRLTARWTVDSNRPAPRPIPDRPQA
ncbi:hypothetical protein SEA_WILLIAMSTRONG_60 [Microbacterium phage WilliamStrong]|nr:hypothetical protein SEA_WILLIAMSTRONG_60 [Microbacterium phage WilliamStrong]